ncbi:MAG: hypothetical protein KatS3mg054_0943 [Chloroflexus sp.]|nr:MAG: hypothetical protein KatS3mg054_0943 [Chloroflexus sp.]
MVDVEAWRPDAEYDVPRFLPHQDAPCAALCARLASAAQGEGPGMRVFRAYPSYLLHTLPRSVHF